MRTTEEICAAIYGEVVTEDIYGLKTVDFQPDVVFDLGANMGVFSRYARTLFPKALIVAIEPNPDNCEVFRRLTKDKDTILCECAIGRGPVYRHPNAANGAMECYVTACTGYEKAKGNIPADAVNAFMPDVLIAQYLQSGQRAILKMDIEGNDNAVWEHAPSIKALRSLDYIAVEVHRYALTGDRIEAVNKLTDEALKSFEATHDCQQKHVIFTARKRVK